MISKPGIEHVSCNCPLKFLCSPPPTRGREFRIIPEEKNYFGIFAYLLGPVQTLWGVIGAAPLLPRPLPPLPPPLPTLCPQQRSKTAPRGFHGESFFYIYSIFLSSGQGIQLAVQETSQHIWLNRP